MIFIVTKDGRVQWPGSIVDLQEGDLLALEKDTPELIKAHAQAGEGRRIVMEFDGLDVAKELKLITSYSTKLKPKGGKK